MIAQAFCLATILDRVVLQQALRPEVGPWLAGLAAALVIRALAVSTRGVYCAHSSARLKANLRHRLFSHALTAGPALRIGHSLGGLSTTLVEKVEALEPYFARYQPQLMNATIIPLAIGLAIVSANWLAGALLVLSAPFIPLFMALIGMGAQQLSQQQQSALDRLSGIFYDRVQGLTTLTRLSAGAQEQTKLRAFSEAFRQRTMRVLRVAFLSSAVLEFFSALAIAVMAIYIGFSLLGFIALGPSEDITLRWGLFMLLLAPEFYNPLRTLGQFWHDRANALAAADALMRLERAPPGRPEPSETQPVSTATLTGAPAITVKDLEVTTPTGRTLISEVNLTCAPGRCHLISGASGSGKTTLLGMLAGFHPVPAGHIHYHHADINHLTRHQLAQCRAWLGQRPLLIEGSLRDNLTLVGEANDDKLMQALEGAGLWAWVKAQPQQLDLQLGPQGLGLSRGQTQRLAIAQVLLTGCPILFLDEPTTGLDADTEAHLWATFRTLAHEHNMTLIAASHSQLADAWAEVHWHIDSSGGLMQCST